MAISPAERSRKARIAALYRALKYDGVEVTQKARDTFQASFASPEARKAYYRALALKSVQARMRKRSATATTSVALEEAGDGGAELQATA
jgi:hypothetical protein